MLYDLVRHYNRYVETKRLKAAGVAPNIQWGEPHFKLHSDGISLPLAITHDNTSGQTRFTGEHTIRMAKLPLPLRFVVFSYKR